VWITLGAALVALACVSAAGRRLAWAVVPTPLKPRLLSAALEGEGASALRKSLQSELARDPRLEWERELFAAFDEPGGASRDALINEQLLEFERRADRWARVPRVCASIGTSAGLLFGSLALLQGLATPAGPGVDAANETLQTALSSALAGVSFGIAATSFCVAVHVRAARASREGRAAVDALVDRLRCVSDTREPEAPSV
jgi:hypothetical protein